MIDYTKPPEGSDEDGEVRDVFDYYPPSELFRDEYARHIQNKPYEFMALDKLVARAFERNVKDVSIDIRLRSMMIYHRAYLVYRNYRESRNVKLSMAAVFFECKNNFEFLMNVSKDNRNVLRGMYIVAYNKTYDIKEITGLIANWAKDMV